MVNCSSLKHFFSHIAVRPLTFAFGMPIIIEDVSILNLTNNVTRHIYVNMIKSFRCKDTEKLFNDLDVKKFRAISEIARIKLELLNATISLNSLRIPPGNRLEQLKGDRKGQHSIRINDLWRICFVWQAENANEVEIVDYYKG